MYSSQENIKPKAHWDLLTAGICFALFTIFMYPLLAAWSLSYDENVQYWIGTYTFWWTLPIPIWFILHWFIQANLNKPKRSLIMASFIVPCVVFFLVGGSIRFKAFSIMDKVSGSDCGVYQETRDLIKSHKEAEKYYKECHPAGGKSGFDVLFQSCAKYKTWRKEDDNAKHWDYLMYLETNFACTGFCKAAEESLWSHKEYHDKESYDACFNVVYSVMDSKVTRSGLLLMIYPVFVLAFFLVWNCAVRPTFQILSAEHRGRGHGLDPAFYEKAKEVAGLVQGKAIDAYGAVQHGAEKAYVAAHNGVDRVDQAFNSPRQQMPPQQQPTFIPASQPMMAPGPPMATMPPGGGAWSAPPAPAYANPPMPPMQR